MEGRHYWSSKDAGYREWYGGKTLPKYPTFTHYDKVLTRYSSESEWRINLFSHWKYYLEKWVAVCINGVHNEENIIPFDSNKVGIIENESKD